MATVIHVSRGLAGQSPSVRSAGVAKIAKPIVETSVKVRQNLEKFVWSS